MIEAAGEGRVLSASGAQHSAASNGSPLPIQLQPLTLDSTNHFLSPEVCQGFDPDSFLLSRRLATCVPPVGNTQSGLTNGALQQQVALQDLHSILAELRGHGELLQDELKEVINRHYREFVGLASEIRSESHRISRLAWQTSVSDNGPDARALVGGLGTSEIRQRVQIVRTALHSVEEELLAVLDDRHATIALERDLLALLELDAAAGRLEHVLGLSKSPTTEPHRLDSLAVQLQHAQAEPISCTDEYLYVDSDETTKKAVIFLEKGPHPKSPPPAPEQLHQTSSTVSLPSPRALCESLKQYQDLRRLLAAASPTADSHVLSSNFLATQSLRLAKVQEKLSEEAELLLTALLSCEDGSLLVNHSSENTWKNSPLAQHTDRGNDALDRRKAEQEDWLSLCIDALAHTAGKDRSVGLKLTASLIRETLVQPALLRNISVEALGRTNAVPLEHDSAWDLVGVDLDSTLGKFYGRLLSVIKLELLPIATSARERVDIFGKVIWPDTLQVLMDTLGSQIFFVGRPETFHSNYRISKAFLRAFVSLAPFSASCQAALEHPTHEAFNKRWQLLIYFQMRQRQIITSLENELGNASKLNEFFGDNKPLMRGTEATLASFATPWSADVHLDDLLLQQWRLSLQICSRYKTWLYSILPDISGDNEEPTKNAASDTRNPSGAGAGLLASGGASPPGGVTPAVPPNTDTTVENERKALTTNSIIIAADLLLLERELLTSFENQVGPRLRALGDNADGITTQLRAKLRQALSFKQFLVPALIRSIKRVVAAQCAEPIRLVRQVSTQYRSGTSSPMGHSRSSSSSQVEPSFFVPHIFVPLRQLFVAAPNANTSPGHENGGLAAIAAGRLDIDMKKDIFLSTVEETVDKYASALFTMNQTHESLRRLKRSNQALGFASSIFGSSSMSSKSTETEVTRMKIQMQADVQALKADLIGIADAAGVDLKPDEMDSWKRLLAAAAGAPEDVS
ncbi:hypothetical protein K437DRAFT_108231 [Tilletiaria anomala UBC 951]|uniref:COG complex component COG2 C-terminal domain-containing protein n=1 Tax=Tilletiaria anomala (strain ATCC 24038 / CBS 436.72 / UBC 951) TaxID=1037660 RepID=A0A066W5A5_TILAU|nr:uncharacterized protein K437DRAFT_108231 [Tilletiaria anomala UBC 951]KDN46259.1 hypothetical protein K437DRAFT_108231 [Tilletiaria anomala UBC 951]